ncbi:MAG: hypothetical protein P8P30_10605 [Rickettsiales bacterium]|nr:hypothetical protein [Rickettsiales bacterium]
MSFPIATRACFCWIYLSCTLWLFVVIWFGSGSVPSVGASNPSIASGQTWFGALIDAYARKSGIGRMAWECSGLA